MEALTNNSKGLIHVHNSLTLLSTFFDCGGSDIYSRNLLWIKTEPKPALYSGFIFCQHKIAYLGKKEFQRN